MLDPINLLVWSIRGTSRADSLRYFGKLCHDNGIRLLILLEPMSSDAQWEVVRRRLRFDKSSSFLDRKIWFFWSSVLRVTSIECAEQLVHAWVSFLSGASFCLSEVYAK